MRIRPRDLAFYLTLFLVISQAGCLQRQQEITMGTLLNEMVDRGHLAEFPDPGYSCRQFSSYNRTSTTPGDYSWFANLDNNYFIRTENNNGRREFVLFDADGPGTVVRFWATFARYKNEGILRFYFDNEEEPRIEGEAMHLLSGGGLAGPPLSFSVSEESDYSRRGHNLYLPLPYAGHLKITFETDGIEQARDGVDEAVNRRGEMFYYQINYRTYEPGTRVETYDSNSLAIYRQVIEEARSRLESCDRQLDNPDLGRVTFTGSLAPEEKKQVSIEGSKAIRKLRLKLKAGNIEQALRSTVLQVSFDGEQTIWAPVGDFFGTGYKISPAKTWYQEVDNGGTLQVFWVMPFQTGCLLTLLNLGTQDVEIIDGEIVTSDWKWDNRSMHFGSSWYQNTRIHTGLEKDRDGHGDMFDINYTTLDGQGVYVGDAVTLFNGSPAWWGEGDEKIFVDREDFPSHFGTGTEDYYGYAWCRPEPFITPFIAQPDGSGNLNVGYTLDMRFRCLDAIPFREQLKFDMELWHWGYTIMNHAPITFWYLKPGGKCIIEPDIAGVKEEVVLAREQIFPPVMNDQGIIEGENLIVDAVSGSGYVRIRPIPVPDKPNWTRSANVWLDASRGDAVTFRFISEKGGSYDVSACILSRGAQARISFLVNGSPVKVASVNAAEKLNEQLLELNQVELSEGYNTITVKLLDLKGAEVTILGIDYMKFRKL